MEKDAADEGKWLSATEIDQLRKLQRNFKDVCFKFSELNHAFRVNIESQRQLEEEHDTLVHDYNRLIEECKSREKVLRIEGNKWREAFLRQRNIVKNCFIEGDEEISTLRGQCNGTIKSIKEKTERRIHELLGECEKSKEQVELLEVKLEASLRAQYETTTRILKLVNLLETRENFHNNESQRHSRWLSKALKAIVEGENFLFEKTIISLSHLSDETEIDRKSESYLVSQNSVLCEIIRNLKKRLQSQMSDAGTKNEKNNNCMSQGTMLNESSKISTPVDNLPCKLNQLSEKLKDINNMKQYELSSTAVKGSSSGKGIHNFHFESIIVEVALGNFNGFEFEECIIKSRSGEELIKLKQSLYFDEKVSFDLKLVKTEREYEDSPLDGTTIYLAHAKAVFNASAQTILSGGNACRINLFSSERKAIERNLSHLEKTMNDLKSTAISQADKTIRKGSKKIIHQLYECLKLLER